MFCGQRWILIRGLKGPALVLALGGAILALLCGCRRSAASLEEATLGGFFVNRAGARVQSQLRIPTTATNVSLGFFVEGLRFDKVEGFQYAMEVSQAIASGKLRVRLALLQEDTANEFYRAEFSLGNGKTVANCGASRLSPNHPLLFVFSGIQPLDNLADYDLEGNATVTYYYRQNEVPLRRGKLVRGADYVVELTVLKPVAITNEFRLWFGSICGPPAGSRPN